MKKTLTIIGGIFVGVIILSLIIFLVISANSEKMVCKSNEGNITIMYNEDTLTGYTANGISYDLEHQKTVAKQIGISQYLEEFSTWFEANTSGTCTKK